jgi:transmembrane secretion effector
MRGARERLFWLTPRLSWGSYACWFHGGGSAKRAFCLPNACSAPSAQVCAMFATRPRCVRFWREASRSRSEPASCRRRCLWSCAWIFIGTQSATGLSLHFSASAPPAAGSSYRGWSGRFDRPDSHRRRYDVAAANFVIAWAHDVHQLWIAIFLAGAAWVATTTMFNSAAQIALPSWVRARALSMYLLVLQGGLALGSVGWGYVASHTGIRNAFELAGLFLLLNVATALRFSLRGAERFDPEPWVH